MTHTIGVIGGTGPQGRGLAYRFALAGHAVTLGSRSAGRATAAADAVNARLAGAGAGQAGAVRGAAARGAVVRGGVVRGAGNARAAEESDLVVLAIPWDGHADTVTALRDPLAGKVVVSCVNPLGFDRHGPFGLDVPEGSAAEQAALLLPDSRVVGAFHHLSADALLTGCLDHEDILVCGDDADAKRIVVDLSRAVTGRPGVDVGALRLARLLEPFTAVLISVNRRYGARSGIAVTGLPA